MKASDYVDGYFLAAQVLAASTELKEKVLAFVDLLRKLKQREGRLFVLGLGGSAANASHAVNDFRKIAGIETYAPTDNVAELTARTNDQDFDSSLSEWLKGSRLRAQTWCSSFPRAADATRVVKQCRPLHLCCLRHNWLSRRGRRLSLFWAIRRVFSTLLVSLLSSSFFLCRISFLFLLRSLSRLLFGMLPAMPCRLRNADSLVSAFL
jgi:hypothetical protein